MASSADFKGFVCCQATFFVLQKTIIKRDYNSVIDFFTINFL